jgi:PAS domain S-box-containing protein
MGYKSNGHNIDDYRNNPVVQQLLEASNDGFWDWNILTGEVYFSNRWCEMLGYKKNEIIPHVSSWEKLVHPDDMSFVMEVLQRHLKGETPYYETEHRVRMKNGDWKWILDRGRVICRDDSGAALRAVGSHVDVGDKKKHEEERDKLLKELEKNQSILNSIMTSSSDLIYIKDSQSHLIAINEAFLKALNFGGREFRREDIIGKSDVDFLGEEYGRPIIENDKVLINNKKTLLLEESTPSVRGHVIYQSLKGPIFDARGEVIGLIGISRDITASKKLETDLKEAILARDEFLSVASHELKTPLSSLLLQAQSLKRSISLNRTETFTPEKLKNFSSMIEEQIIRLVRLVDDMLDISRLQSGKFTIRKEHINLSELIKLSSEKFESQVKASTGVSIVLEIESQIFGNWDKQRIDQVVSNLLSNALKYGARKPIKLGTHLKNNNAYIFVQDQGKGIEQQNLDRIFWRFERVYSTDEVGGLGMGLYIARQIVEAHGGRIWVESEVGKGSLFWVELPLDGG